MPYYVEANIPEYVTVTYAYVGKPIRRVEAGDQRIVFGFILRQFILIGVAAYGVTFIKVIRNCQRKAIIAYS